MAKIVSFDVGIKNLAYCILDINDDKKTFEIIKWDVIDLTTNTVKYICSYVNNNVSCNKQASKYFVENNILVWVKRYITFFPFCFTESL